jgi:serine/threonine protein kinase
MTYEANPNTIESLIKNGHLQEALSAMNTFFDLCDSQRVALISLNSQMSEWQRRSEANVLGPDAVFEQNKIRMNFQNMLFDFRKKVLTQYFDIRGYPEFFSNISHRDTVIEEILDLRLLPKRYIRDETWPKREGNSSIIYRLHNPDTKRHTIAMVIKVPELGEKVKRDIAHLTHLKHRNVIKLIDHETDAFPFFIISEYVYGENLADAIALVGPRPASQVSDWLYQLTDALDYLRHKRILHTNVRPSKIYVDDEWQVMISPLDLIKMGISNNNSMDSPGSATQENPAERTFFRYRDVCQYGSPELFARDGEGFDDTEDAVILDKMCVSDLYSIGLVGYMLLTGEDLFEGKYLYEILENRRKFQEKNSAYKKAKLSKLPKDALSNIIRKLLIENPKDRKVAFADLHQLLLVLNPLTRKNYYTEEDTVRQSYRRCLARNREFIRDFYTDFLKETPYKADFTEMVQKRQSVMLQMAIDLLIDVDNKAAYLKKIMSPENPANNKHGKYQETDFRHFLDTLLKTVEKNDPKFPEVKLEWQSVIEKTLLAIQNIRATTAP